MKPNLRAFSRATAVSGGLAFLLSGCLSFGDEYKVLSEVHEDGSIDRTITYYSSDTVIRDPNTFGASPKSGWTQTNELPSDTSLHGTNFRFTKHYASADSASVESGAVGHPYRIKSEFESQFKWFITTIRYTDTYQPVIHFESVSLDDYFDEEDFQYLNQELLSDSKADSTVELKFDKHFDQYLTRAYFEALVTKVEGMMRNHAVEPRWIDTLRAHKESFYTYAMEVNSVDEMGIYLTDKLHLPLKDFLKPGDMELKEFYNAVPIFDRVKHTIIMPGDIVKSNASTTNGNMASWEFKAEHSLIPFSMSAESRKINYWAILITVGILVGLFMTLRRRTAPAS